MAFPANDLMNGRDPQARDRGPPSLPFKTDRAAQRRHGRLVALKALRTSHAGCGCRRRAGEAARIPGRAVADFGVQDALISTWKGRDMRMWKAGWARAAVRVELVDVDRVTNEYQIPAGIGR
jgi:hypothetical protein